MDKEEITDFPIFYSTDKKKVIEFADKVYNLAKHYGWINIRDFIKLWYEPYVGTKDSLVYSGSVQWCVEYKDLPRKHNIKKDKTHGWYLEMPAAYLF